LYEINIEERIKRNLWIETKMSPSLILVLRKLQKVLEINTAQLKFQEKKSLEVLESLIQGKALRKEFIDEGVMTETIRELSQRVKVLNLFECRCCS